MEKLKIAYPIIVEGKYDKLRLQTICEGLIIKTDGFGVFKKNEKAALIRALASKSRIIVLTDSDGGGKVIRSHISALVPKDKLIQLYIPRIEGKEKRKSEPSKEGTLGVEGMEGKLLLDLLAPFENKDISARLCVAVMLDEGKNYQEISKATGASTATISRVKKCLVYGSGGYRTTLDRAKKENKS